VRGLRVPVRLSLAVLVIAGVPAGAVQAVPTYTALDLGTLPGDSASEARAISDDGVVVGFSSGPRGTRAVLWTPTGAIQDLGTLPGDTQSRALGINNAGVVVGSSRAGDHMHAFVWSSTGGMEDLNTLIPPSPFTVLEAVAINERGVILAAAQDKTETTDHHAEHPTRVVLLEP